MPNEKVPLMSVNMIKQSAQSENLSLKAEVDTLLVELGVEPVSYTGGTLVAKTPITGETLAHVREVDAAGATSTIEKAHAAFLEWRLIPRRRRHHLGVQFPGRGLVMECRAGTGLRQQRRLEAVGEDSAHRLGGGRAVRTRSEALQGRWRLGARRVVRRAGRRARDR